MRGLMMAAVAVLGVTAAPAAAAEYIFTFTTSQQLFGGPVSGSGSFFTSDTATTVGGRTAFTITSITGMVNGSAIVAPTGNYGNYFTSGNFLDGSGVRFFTAANNDVRFFNQSSNGLYRVNTFSPGSSSFVDAASSAAISAVPEPATWGLMILGFGATGAALRSRRRHLRNAAIA